MTQIFDTHAHYDDEAFDQDREELLKQLPEKGIARVVNVGAGLASCKRTAGLMADYDYIYGAMGVHPEETAGLQEGDMDWLGQQCRLDKCVAVGEIGLDYYWDSPDRETQKRWFARQLELAREVKLPVIIHSRDAAKDTLDILKDWDAHKTKGVIHCFSYTWELAKEYLSMGYYFGIGGVLTFKNAKKLVEAVEHIPMEKILLETDCPYLAPEPFRGKRNRSDYIYYVADKLAELKNISREEVLRITGDNARDFYGIGITD